MLEDRKTHESYGNLQISKFSSNHSEFFGSDLVHRGGYEITISNCEIVDGKRYFPTSQLIRIRLSYNQFVDAITSSMNGSGVPCTIDHVLGKRTERISYIEDKKEVFKGQMKKTNSEYIVRINNIINEFGTGNIGKRKQKELLHELQTLKNHLLTNTQFVMDCFNEEMDKTVLEAKQNISGYIDNKVNTLGIEKLRDEISVSLGTTENKKLDE